MSDASSSGFGKFVPGFEFLQNLAGQAAGGVAQGMGAGMSQMPNLGNWVAPTFNVEDLEKRIQELKAVHFWLDQNAKALSATIQALEVQKMTLLTLKNMNFSLGDVASALKIPPTGTADTAASATAAAPTRTPFAGLEIPPRTYGMPQAAPAEEPPEDEPDEAPPEPPAPPRADPRPRKSAGTDRAKAGAAAPSPAGVVDPVQWWDALTQQFQQIAANAMKDVTQPAAGDAARQAASGVAETSPEAPVKAAVKPAAPKQARPKPAPKAKTRAPAPARKKAAPATARRTAAPTQALSTGDWPMPTAFFPLAGFGGATAQPAAAKRTAAKTPAPARKPAARKPAARKAAPAPPARKPSR